MSNQSQVKYYSLDGLRAMAAICIVMMHVMTALYLHSYSWCGFINSFTNFTFMFMTISAFGLCCGYYDKFKNGQVSLNSFYKKRYTRILPFFALLILIDLAMKPSLSELYEGFANLTLAFGLLPNAGITVVGVGWFLGVIFVFYMIFPFFVFLIDNKRRAWFVLLIAVLLHFLAISYFSRSELMVKTVGKWNIVYSFPYFVVGGLIFLYKDEIVRVFSRLKAISLVLLIAAIVGYYVLPKVELFSELVVFSMFVIYAITRTDNKGLFNNKIAKFLSDISMEIYLCHMFFFRAVEMCHLEKYIQNEYLLYVIVFLLTFGGAMLFSLGWKRLVEPRVLKMIE